MRTNPLRAKLQRGETVFGPMVMEFTSPGLPQILAGVGADFIVYDQELFDSRLNVAQHAVEG